MTRVGVDAPVPRGPHAAARWRSSRTRQIRNLIYPVSFYRNKAVHVQETCQQILSRFGGRVPSTMEELLTLPGVGRKTANLVLILAHASDENICVDTHVHRISNRLGWVRTRTPEDTEHALYRVDAPPLVADHQSVPGDVGAERLPAGVSSVSPVRARRHLSESRRHEGGEATGQESARCADVADRAAWLVTRGVCDGRRAARSRSRRAPGRSSCSRPPRARSRSRPIPKRRRRPSRAIVELVKKGFYNGLALPSRRAELPGTGRRSGRRGREPGSVLGSGGRGKPIGVAEITKKRQQRRSARSRWRIRARRGWRRQPVLHPAPRRAGARRQVHRVRPCPQRAGRSREDSEAATSSNEPI